MRGAAAIVWAYLVSWGLMALIALGDQDVGSLTQVFAWRNLVPVSIFALLPFMLIVACQQSVRHWGVLAGGGVSLATAAILVLGLNAVIITAAPPSPLQQTLATLIFAGVFLFGSIPAFFGLHLAEEPRRPR